MLDHYLHTAHAAALLLYPHRDSITVAPPHPGVSPERLDDLADALAWFTAEHAVLLAAIRQAVDAGFDIHAWQLAWTLTTFFDRQGHWRDQAATPLIALNAAERAGDRVGQAHAHRDLARAYARLGRFAEAHPHLERSLRLFGALSDLHGQARTYLWLGMVFERQDRYADALGHAQHALDLYRAAGDRAGPARALNSLGWDHILLGDHRQALEQCQEALALHQQVGNRAGQADTWDSLGHAHFHLGDYPAAIACYQDAIDMYRQVGDRYGEADTLVRLGDTHRAAGDCEPARAAWQQALVVLDQLNPGDADQVRAKLHDLTAAG